MTGARGALVLTEGSKTGQVRTDVLWCPEHNAGVRSADGQLVCEAGHDIPIECGVPVFAADPRREPTPLNMPAMDVRTQPSAVDEFVDDWIVNTNGNLCWRVRGRLPRYPIPAWPARPASKPDGTLVDIGCSWGRWTIAAARSGYATWGIDVHINALWAARRVTRELGVQSDFACCDAAHLPFRPNSIDFVFSYSVLQHLAKDAVRTVLKEIARILRPGGTCLVQLPNAFGAMSLLRRARRGFREAAAGTFEMRYWKRREIQHAFRDAGLSDVHFGAEGFFLQNTQRDDSDLLSTAGAMAMRTSLALRDLANRAPALVRFADSLWVEAKKGR
ncbi:MAG TPA: class I SAM-dependent methyltransferase [Candidatus Acidoferrales bacterium]|nr:class I SAM-dependent methyltransferase [Candidatus Acidoferrales bacterium]